jgi:hypothetical protein
MVKGVMTTVFAVLAVAGVVAASDTGIELAQADQCVQQCRSAHNQCRITSKGSPSCDSQLQACMDSCRSRR